MVVKTNPAVLAALMLATTFASCVERRAGDVRTNSTTAETEPGARAKPHPETLVIATGTDVVVVLYSNLSTDTNRTGDRFEARTVHSILVDGQTVVPAGAPVRGVLRDVESSGRISGRARMTLDFGQIADGHGNYHPIEVRPLTLMAASEPRSDLETIAGAGVLGAFVVGVDGGSAGAGTVAGSGAAAGTILRLATRDDEVELSEGRRLNVHFLAPISIELKARN